VQLSLLFVYRNATAIFPSLFVALALEKVIFYLVVVHVFPLKILMPGEERPRMVLVKLLFEMEQMLLLLHDFLKFILNCYWQVKLSHLRQLFKDLLIVHLGVIFFH
jgi:hypothetical protein